MTINSLNAVGTYTDLQGLQSLHHQLNTHPDEAKKEVAAQFESLLVQMLMKSMRDANKALSNDPENDSFGSQQTDLYNDLMDKQLSLVVSHSDTGLAKMIEASLNKEQPVQRLNTPSMLSMPTMPNGSRPMHEKTAPSPTIEPPRTKINRDAAHETKAAPASAFNTMHDFVKTLWSSAKEAASELGTDPKLLLAQAALETNWGKSVLPMISGQSTHNLFNIKADPSWNKPLTQVDAIEYEDGLMVKNKSKFRAYESYTESFNDYVHFLKNNGRYQDALKSASNPQQFAQALQKASYATDSQYSSKIMQIYSSKKFNDVFAEENLI